MSKATNNMTNQKAVSPQEKAAFFAEFNNGLHRIGRITLVLAVIMLVSVPFIVGAMNGVMPDMKGFLKGFATVGLIYIPVAIVEFLVYTKYPLRNLPVLFPVYSECLLQFQPQAHPVLP